MQRGQRSTPMPHMIVCAGIYTRFTDEYAYIARAVPAPRDGYANACDQLLVVEDV
jgi:hypothetical protein